MMRGFSKKSEALKFIETISFKGSSQEVKLTYKGKVWIVTWKQ